MNFTNLILNVSLYIFFKLLSFINNIQYKRSTILLLENKNNDLIKKINNLEEHIDELELQNNIRKIRLKLKEEEEEEAKTEGELLQMSNEDKDKQENTLDDVVNVIDANIVVVKDLDNDLVDLSEEMYPTKNQNNQNKKGWFKTLLFM
jgi:hypothetical protein